MKSIEQLYHLYGGRVYAYLLRLTGDRELAGDLTQETFCRCLTAIASYRSDASLVTWLHGIARNVYRDEMRRRSRMGLQDSADDHLSNLPAPGSDPADVLLAHERRSDIQAVLSALPLAYREVLVLKDFQGMDHKEIASIMQQSVNWVRVTYYRARLKFRALYLDREERQNG